SSFLFQASVLQRTLHSFPTRRSSDLPPLIRHCITLSGTWRSFLTKHQKCLKSKPLYAHWPERSSRFAGLGAIKTVGQERGQLVRANRRPSELARTSCPRSWPRGIGRQF